MSQQSTNEQKPSVARVVHYQPDAAPGAARTPEPLAAIITAVHDNDIDLCVFSTTGLMFVRHVRQASPRMPGVTCQQSGCWNWPPRQ